MIDSTINGLQDWRSEVKKKVWIGSSCWFGQLPGWSNHSAGH